MPRLVAASGIDLDDGDETEVVVVILLVTGDAGETKAAPNGRLNAKRKAGTRFILRNNIRQNKRAQQKRLWHSPSELLGCR